MVLHKSAGQGVAFTLTKNRQIPSLGVVRSSLSHLAGHMSIIAQKMRKKQPCLTFFMRQGCLCCIYFGKVAFTLKFNLLKHFGRKFHVFFSLSKAFMPKIY